MSMIDVFISWVMKHMSWGSWTDEWQVDVFLHHQCIYLTQDSRCGLDATRGTVNVLEWCLDVWMFRDALEGWYASCMLRDACSGPIWYAFAAHMAHDHSSIHDCFMPDGCASLTHVNNLISISILLHYSCSHTLPSTQIFWRACEALIVATITSSHRWDDLLISRWPVSDHV